MSPAAPPDPRRGLRYVAVGAFNTAFGLGSFAVLHLVMEPSTGYMPVLVLAWVINVLEAYAAYRLLVFRVEGHVLRDLARFSSVYALAFAFNLVALPFGVEVAGLPVLVTQAVVMVVTVVASYAGHSRFSFRREEPQAPVPPGALTVDR